MKWLLIFVFAFFAQFSVAQLVAQLPVRIVHLDPADKLSHFQHLPFNKVTVFDNRLDTSKIGWGFEGHSEVMKLDCPVPVAIKSYIEAAIGKRNGDAKTLYINVKQLRFRIAPVGFYFSADAFFQTDSGFEKVATLKRHYHLSMGNKGRFGKTIVKSLNDLIGQACMNHDRQINIDKNSYTIESINTSVTNDWQDYPIMKPSALLTNGVYRSFDDFLHNKIEIADVSLRPKPDSTYTYSYANDRTKKKRIYIDYQVYAVCYNGGIYLNLYGTYLLPLSKINGALYFYIPLSLPNMQAIKEASLINDNLDLTDSQNETNIYGAVMGLVFGAVLQSIISERNERDRKRLLHRGLASGDMRTCFIDMDTGNIIY